MPRAELAAMVEGTTAEELAQAEAALARPNRRSRMRMRAARLEVRAPVAGRVGAALRAG
jgi:multidrug resistance efflux pump